MHTSMRKTTTAVPQSVTANEIVDKHYKGQDKSIAQHALPHGTMPTGTFLVCGECSDEGGGSSGQCACH